MAISSASTRIFKAEDPVMETDLQLLAKVNEYQQDKFDQGEKQLQDEINNWSLLSKVAKPQDRDYINGKLTGLVSRIDNLGGVNLADPNNVNSLKSLGYSLYGDEKVMQPVLTTQKMNALGQDIQQKTNGKNAKNYDSVYGEYLLNSYQDWLNDGQQGTGFSGPTALPQGSFDGYNTKVNEAISKLQPDINEAPVDSKDAALNYYQVGDKFIKKDRIIAAVDAVTSAQDKAVLTAHAWKSTQGVPDQHILDLQNREYDSKINDMQENFNYLQYQKSLTTDFKQKQLFESQMNELKNGISSITKQKSTLPQLQPGQEMPKELRQQIADNLFNSAYRQDIANARSYEQKKTELKTNAAAVFQQKQAQEDYWHGKNYELKQRELDIKEEGTFAKMYNTAAAANGRAGKLPVQGPAQTAPLSLVPVQGKNDAIVLSNDSVVQADANYTAAATNYFEQGYNYLMSKDPTLYGNFLRQDPDGHWIPKDERSRGIVNKGLQSFNDLFGNIANMSIKERNGLTLNSDDLELFQQGKNLEEAQLYKKQMKDVQADVFRLAGLEDPNTKTATINFAPGSKFGSSVSVPYAKLKEMIDKKDPLLDEWKKESNFSSYSPAGGSMASVPTVTNYNSANGAVEGVKNFFNDSKIQKAWETVSKTVNPYSQVVSLPKQKNGRLPDQPAKILVDQIKDAKIKADVDINDVDLNKVWTVFDPKTLDVKYMGEIKYRNATGGKDAKGTGGDKTTTIDLTDAVNQQYNNGGGWISNLYAHDNASIVYGMALQNNGKTPFDPSNNYKDALQTHGQGLLSHKYQIVSVPDPKTKGVTGYKVFVAVPLGKDEKGIPKFQVMPVPNFAQDASGKTTTFPANFDGVRTYMEAAFRDTNAASDFYARIGVPYNQ